MIVQENLHLSMINEDPFFKETEFQNPEGARITIPARSVMWTDYNDDNGHPVYEFASLDYVRPEQNEDRTFNLIATPVLEEDIKNRKETHSDKQSRVFHLVIKRRNSKTGEFYPYEYSESAIQEKLSHGRVSYQFGIATHSCDLYTEDDERKQIDSITKEYRASGSSDEGGLEDYLRLHRTIFKGNQKPQHIHALIRNEKVDNKGDHVNMRLSSIAKKLGYPEFCFQTKYDNSERGGSDGFIDGIRYLTHETEKAVEDGKYQYPDSIRTVNFDWKNEYEQILAERKEFGNHKMTPQRKLRHKVMYGGMTLKQCEQFDPILYLDDFEKLKKYRSEYLTKHAPLPVQRINYYIDGPGGIGKNCAARAFARSLFPNLDDDDCYFIVGGKNVSFDGYDGQPVIIWNDCRAIDLIMKFGRGEVFDIFDSHPSNASHHIKYGNIRLINEYNIVNGIQDYREFLDGLAGEYEDRYGNTNEAEDKSQAYRRFPIITCLEEESLSFLLNKGVAEGTREYDQYIAYKSLVGNFGQIAQRLEGKAKEITLISMTKPLLEITEKVKQAESEKISDPEKMPEKFKYYGTEVKPSIQIVEVKTEEEFEKYKEEAKKYEEELRRYKEEVKKYEDEIRIYKKYEEGLKDELSSYSMLI